MQIVTTESLSENRVQNGAESGQDGANRAQNRADQYETETTSGPTHSVRGRFDVAEVFIKGVLSPVAIPSAPVRLQDEVTAESGGRRATHYNMYGECESEAGTYVPFANIGIDAMIVKRLS